MRTSARRLGPLALLLALLGAATAPARAGEGAGERPDAEAARAARMRVCTPLTCGPRPASPLGATAGFALAVLAAARLAGRPRG